MPMPVAVSRFLYLFSQPTSHPITESIFLRLLGLVYLSAFGSLWPQITGLIGSRGIVSAATGLSAMRSEVGGWQAFFISPSLFFLGINDHLLIACCVAGCIFSLLLILGFLRRLAAFACWALYLSIVSVGAPFLNFQWDALLLECGALAIFAGAPFLVWAYRFLLFRLMFQSGTIKFLSGDVNWSNLHALRFHFLTQPLPNPIAYYVYRSPTWLLDGMTAATLLIEVIVPFGLFGPRRVRQVTVALLALLQVCIILTGNYAFFNWLTLALCVWGLDDRTFASGHRLASRRRIRIEVGAPVLRGLGNVALAIYLLLSSARIAAMFRSGLARPFRTPLRLIAPFDLVNSYGLFAVMTTDRQEIVLQGSNDQIDWRDYSFPYKPGEMHRGLPIIAPYQPRLDWQMWFAALGSYGENAWVGNLMYCILVGDPVVLKLLDTPPFSKPPRYLRAVTYDYTFTASVERKQTGATWNRTLRGIWFGPVSLTGR